MNGTYQDNTGQTSCLSCPAGKSCIDVSATPVDCAAGFYSAAAEGICAVSLIYFYVEYFILTDEHMFPILLILVLFQNGCV